MTPEEHYEKVRSAFAGRPGVADGRMFQSEGLTYEGKFFVALARERQLLVKLPADRVAELVDSGAGLPFTRGERVPMREWALIPLDSEAPWPDLAEEALRFAHTLAR